MKHEELCLISLLEYLESNDVVVSMDGDSLCVTLDRGPPIIIGVHDETNYYIIYQNSFTDPNQVIVAIPSTMDGYKSILRWILNGS